RLETRLGEVRGEVEPAAGTPVEVVVRDDLGQRSEARWDTQRQAGSCRGGGPSTHERPACPSPPSSASWARHTAAKSMASRALSSSSTSALLKARAGARTGPRS